MGEPSPPLDAATERALAASLAARVRDLLAAPPSSERDAALVHAAHASCHHRSAGTPADRARAERLVARVYSELGRAEPALYHARRCLDLVQSHADACDELDAAAGLEAVARAELVTGDLDAAADYARQARATLAQIDDPEARAAVEADLDALGLG